MESLALCPDGSRDFIKIQILEPFEQSLELLLFLFIYSPFFPICVRFESSPFTGWARGLKEVLKNVADVTFWRRGVQSHLGDLRGQDKPF